MTAGKADTSGPISDKALEAVEDNPCTEFPSFASRPISFLTFGWFSQVLWLGWKRPVVPADLPHLAAPLVTSSCYPAFERAWFAQRDNASDEERAATIAGKSSKFLFRALLKVHFLALAAALVLQCSYTAFQFAGPLLLKQIVVYLQQAPGQSAGLGKAYAFACLMFVFPLAGAFLYVHSSRIAIRVQILLRAQLTAAVYRKSLRLSSRSRQQTEVGRVVNLMSADVNNIMQFFYPFFLQLFSAPLSLVASLVLLWFQIRWATFIGMAILLLSTPSTALFVKKLTGYRRQMLVQTDARIKLMNQLLVGIRVLKIYAWEAAQEAAVLETRRLELGRLAKAIPYRVGMQTLLFAAPVLAAVASFAAYGVAAPDQFTAPRIFSAIALFSLMRLPLILLPFALVELGNTIVSMRRLSQFLGMEERAESVQQLDFVGAAIDGGEFFWADVPKIALAPTKAEKKAAAQKAKQAEKQAAKAEKEAARAAKSAQKANGGSAADGARPPVVETSLGDVPKQHAVVQLAGMMDHHAPATAEANEAAAHAGHTEVESKSRTVPPRTGDSASSMPVWSPKVAPESAESAESTASTQVASEVWATAHEQPAEELVASTQVAPEVWATAHEQPVEEQNGMAGKLSSQPPVPAAPSEGGVANAAWWLRNVNLELLPGQLVCVVGRVGSGKSSLVSALLGEMERHAGTVRLGGRVAYVAQQAWIVNDSLRNNITFGKEFDPERWQMCLEACSLKQDLEVLPAGEETEIGEKGINLSGGQKQRVSIARAVYQDADIYILDDPLSAVDVHVGRHIFEKCVAGVLASKARLLVTNQLQYLPQADRIVYIEDGQVAAQGTYEEVCGNEMFSRLLNEFNAGGQEEPELSTLDSGDEIDALMSTDLTRRASHQLSDSGAPVLTSTDLTRRISRQLLDSDVARQTEQEAFIDAANPRALLPRAGITTTMTAADYGGDGPEAAGRSQSLGDGPQTADGIPLRWSGADTSVHGSVDDLDRQPSGWGPHHSARSLSPHTSRRSLTAESSQRSINRPRPHSSRKSLNVMDGRAASGSLREASQKSGSAAADKDKFVGPKLGGLMQAEDQAKGQVTSKTYLGYLRRYGLISITLLVCLWSGEQTVRVLTNWWLSRWTGAQVIYEVQRRLGLPASNPGTRYLAGYLGFAVAYVVLTCIRALTNLLSGLRASRKVHSASLASLVRAPVTFFDTTPVGRILNRFSKDTDDMDYLLPMGISDFGNCMMQLASTLIFISCVQYYFLAGVVPLMILYFFIQKFYRRSFVELQRNDAVTRSPVYAHFSESLAGVDTIRAYGLQEQFCRRSDTQIDFNHKAYWALRTAEQWLSLRLDLIGSLLILITAILAIANRDHIGAGLAALSLSEVLDVTGFLKYAVNSAASLETRFNSVERLLAYTQLPQEAARHVPEHKPRDSWPEQGVIEYQDVHMRYRPELDPVLKGVSFQVTAGEKVGIVGRTGSGKSSLIVTLFRLVEPFRGAILLDGMNLLQMGLEDVRSRIAAIPQDPVLFSGSVRTNLDPYNTHQDAELWEALGHVALKAVVAGLPEGLGARVAEGGDNFSVGQRQLLCVARALLRKPRVLVADEATASVDGETDALIQRTIRANFQDSTVLTIAHRLNTILDSTKVLVMEDGYRKEYGTVPELLGDANGVFRAMVVDAGLTDDSTIITHLQPSDSH
ncbi:hypothetical protein WJX72_006059 [[Myrmecia] bisecta]|uniref:Uncharacterized protein n=1 Tax=[Myrmecia] bisecta TaxID=41462 RepID=A0AAW1QQV0_9CHLO